MDISRLVISIFAVSFFLVGVMILLTPRRGFRLISDKATAVRCNRCGLALLKEHADAVDMTCPICGNTGWIEE